MIVYIELGQGKRETEKERERERERETAIFLLYHTLPLTDFSDFL